MSRRPSCARLGDGVGTDVVDLGAVAVVADANVDVAAGFCACGELSLDDNAGDAVGGGLGRHDPAALPGGVDVGHVSSPASSADGTPARSASIMRCRMRRTHMPPASTLRL